MDRGARRGPHGPDTQAQDSGVDFLSEGLRQPQLLVVTWPHQVLKPVLVLPGELGEPTTRVSFEKESGWLSGNSSVKTSSGIVGAVPLRVGIVKEFAASTNIRPGGVVGAGFK